MDNEQFAARVSSAAKAGWIAFILFTLIIFAYWALVAWGLSAQPDWLLKAIAGGDATTWADLRGFMYTEFSVYDEMFIGGLGVLIFLSLWARKLRN
jgi:hypothetical protein